MSVIAAIVSWKGGEEGADDAIGGQGEKRRGEDRAAQISVLLRSVARRFLFSGEKGYLLRGRYRNRLCVRLVMGVFIAGGCCGRG